MATDYDIKIICDCREDFQSFSSEGFFNDHQDKGTFLAIESALCKAGYSCSIFGGVPQLIKALDENRTFENELFLNLSDGMSQQYSRTQVPILCDLLDVAYTGGGPFAVSLASNKHYAKQAAKETGAFIPKGMLLARGDEILSTEPIEHARCLVKPNSEGSSVGIFPESVCDGFESACRRASTMLKAFDEVLIEEYIEGYDATVFIVGNHSDVHINEVLVIEHHGKLFFDSEVVSIDDYVHGGTRSLPAKGILPSDVISLLEETSMRIATHMRTYDIARLDYRVTSEGVPYFLEINTVPAINRNSQAGAVCETLGIDLSAFLDALVSSATRRLSL